MKYGVQIPLIEEQVKRKKIVTALWCNYVGILCVSLVLERSWYTFVDNELGLLSLIVLLYATHYFSCRTKGNNFLFQAWGVVPTSRGALLASDALASIMYISFFGVLIYQVMMKTLLQN